MYIFTFRTHIQSKPYIGAPIYYELLEHTIMLDLSHFYKFFPKNGKIRSNAAVT